jgi:dihydropteroate synthase
MMIWKLRSKKVTIDRPILMGILNVTPDSFYDGGVFLSPEKAVARTQLLAEEGADLIDVGAQSTRPGAKAVSETEELERLIPVLRKLVFNLSIPISVDTTKSKVARCALECGVEVVNDVSGLKEDSEMAKVVSSFGAGVVLMHRRGNSETMQQMTQYDDVVETVSRELGESVHIARRHHICDESMVIDPGIGFSKNAEQSMKLIGNLSSFSKFERPILVGPSRKSFIGAVTGGTPENRLFGTVASCVLAYERGAHIFRVHDVAAIREALKVSDVILRSAAAKDLEIARSFTSPRMTAEEVVP